jgi:hypothetical protein
MLWPLRPHIKHPVVSQMPASIGLAAQIGHICALQLISVEGRYPRQNGGSASVHF